MIEQTVARVVYQGDGRTKEFPFAFPVLDRKFIYVVISDRNGREKTLKSDYYVDMDKHVVLYPGYPKGEEPAEAERPAVLAPGEKLLSTGIRRCHSLRRWGISGRSTCARKHWIS